LLYTAAMLVFFLGTERLFGRTTALVASFVSLTSLSELFFNNLACSEVLATLFVGLFLLVMVAEARPWRRAVLVGLLLGLSIYNRSNMLTMVAAAAIIELILWRAGWRVVPRLAGAQAVIVLVLLPLCVYNYKQWGRFTPVPSNSGVQLWYGNNPEVSPGRYAYARLPEEFPLDSPERTRLRRAYAPFASHRRDRVVLVDPYDLSDVGVRYALDWIRANPGQYGRMVISRVRQLFDRCTFGIAPYLFYDPSRPDQPRWRDADRRLLLGDVPVRLPEGQPNPKSTVYRLSEVWYQVLLGASLAGVLLTLAVDLGRRHRTAALVPLIILLVYSFPFFLTIALNRYHIPVLPLLWVYLARGLVLAGEALRIGLKGHAARTSHAG
jgi:4-amino-4-deoxy-L-arabinose transferase-like glycosyltransferase